MKKVQVLMSTYNGEMFIREQIDSIIKQDYSNIELLIRDDGSTDGTIHIIDEYATKYNNIKYYLGKNLGSCQSFFDLLINADTNSDYYAFADQDDYWLPNKISRAIEAIEKENIHKYLMYASKAIVVDENLNPLKSKNRKEPIIPGFGNALVENVCIGCSIVFNNQLFNLIIDKIPKNAFMHDWWLYLVTSCFGEIIYDNESCLLYRQHNNNVIGMKDGFVAHWIKRFSNYGKMKKIRELQLCEFNNLFSLNDNKQKIVKDLIQTKHSIKARIIVLKLKIIYRQKLLDDMVFKLLLLLNGY